MKYKSLAKLGFYDKKKVKNKLISFLNKVMVCTVILLVGLIVLKKNPEVKEYVSKKVFNDNFSFAYIKKKYNEYFGDLLPSINGDTVGVFNEKLVYKNKKAYLDGYLLEVDTNYLVPIIETGIVVYTGEKEGYGNVIIVEQVDGFNVWYGNVLNSNVKLYDYVTKGDFLGETKDNNLYLVLEKDGEYLDIENILS